MRATIIGVNVNRFGVSMENELVVRLDRLVERDGYANRSEALRALVRRELVGREHADRGSSESPDRRSVAGIVTLLYEHGRRLSEVPVDPWPSVRIASNLKLHLEGSIVLKVLVVQGEADEVRDWAQSVIRQRGVIGELNVVANEEVYAAFGDDREANEGEPNERKRDDRERHE